MIQLAQKAAPLAVLLTVCAVAAAQAPQPPRLTVNASGDSVAVNAGDRPVLRYVTIKPPDVKLPVDSAAYFHPVMTPSGVVVTDVAPADHPHHRGIFLAWVEMHGKKDADFWGWGEHAPIKDRRIICHGVARGTREGPVAAFQARS